MSSTRRAKDQSVYHQVSYASSPEFERGLLGNLVARRAALLDDDEDKELIWAVHFLSHQNGGIDAVARELLANYPDRIGTAAMLAQGKSGDQIHTDGELDTIAGQFPAFCHNELFVSIWCDRETHKALAYKKRQLESLRLSVELHDVDRETRSEIETLAEEIAQIEDRQKEAENQVIKYSARELQRFCIEAGQGSLNLPGKDKYPLAEVLADLCLKPSRDLHSVAPWYFAGFIECLRDYIQKWIARETNFPETSLGKIVADEFDYTLRGRCLSLLYGEARRGKSLAAKMCCLKRIGRARFVEVPPGNDDTSFFRALARGLGLGNFSNYKAIEIREKVESVLFSGDLLLVLDEAQRLWPQRNLRYGYPHRINWLMMLVNAKVPVLLISTPQFLTGKQAAEKVGWNSAQLTGRIQNQRHLPNKLDNADLMAVCRFMLPEISDEVLNVLANYALISDRYLAAIEAVAMRARHIANKNQRIECNAKDVHQALKENIIPSDNLLNRELEKSRAESKAQKLPRPEFSTESIPVSSEAGAMNFTADRAGNQIGLNRISKSITKESHA